MLRYANPSITKFEFDKNIGLFNCQSDSSFESEFEGIWDQIDKNLL